MRTLLLSAGALVAIWCNIQMYPYVNYALQNWHPFSAAIVNTANFLGMQTKESANFVYCFEILAFACLITLDWIVYKSITDYTYDTNNTDTQNRKHVSDDRHECRQRNDRDSDHVFPKANVSAQTPRKAPIPEGCTFQNHHNQTAIGILNGDLTVHEREEYAPRDLECARRSLRTAT